jgi:hypothetical protein
MVAGQGKKECSVKLTNIDFLVKKKIQQKNQLETPIYRALENAKNHSGCRNGDPCAKGISVLYEKLSMEGEGKA